MSCERLAYISVVMAVRLAGDNSSISACWGTRPNKSAIPTTKFDLCIKLSAAFGFTWTGNSNYIINCKFPSNLQ